MKILLLALIICLAPLNAFAQEKLGTPEYSPDYCQFTATFPEEPYITHQCEDPENPETCFNLVTYTKVFDMASTVRFEIICNPSSAEMYEQFTPEIMENTVKAMTKDSVLETFELNTQQREKYRHTGLVGKGRQGLDDSLLITQIWISDRSIMSVEGEINGEPIPEADQLFAEILRSIGFIEDINKQSSGPVSAPPSP